MNYKKHFFEYVPQWRKGGKTYFCVVWVIELIGRDATYLEEMMPHMIDRVWHQEQSWVDLTDVRILLRDAGTDVAKHYYDALFGKINSSINPQAN